tara:strand:- start:253 stop:375 length:123 start_codon:yes stop_codon:yes gene_type:complete
MDAANALPKPSAGKKDPPVDSRRFLGRAARDLNQDAYFLL